MSVFGYLSLEAIARRLQAFPEVYSSCYDIKFLFQRCKIYELIICGKFESSIEFFNFCFNSKIVHEKYYFLIEYFSEIFRNFNISQKVLLDKYLKIKKALMSKTNAPYLNVLDNKKLIIFKNHKLMIPDSYLFIFDNEIKDNSHIELLDCEFDLIKEIKIENRSQAYKENHLGKFEDIADNMQEEGSLFEEIFDIPKTTNSYNNNLIDTINNNDSKDIRNNNISLKCILNKNNNNRYYSYKITNEFYSNPSIKENFRESKIDVKKFIINCDEDIESNNKKLIDYIGVPEFNAPKIGDLYKFKVFFGTTAQKLFMMTYNINIHTNQVLSMNRNSIESTKFMSNKEKCEFLNSFSPKFTKKEALNKMIIRKFHKYLRKKLKKDYEIIDSANLKCNSIQANRDKNYDIEYDYENNYIQDCNMLNSMDNTLKESSSSVLPLSTYSYSHSSDDNNTNDASHISSMNFALEFVSLNYLPPFKYNNNLVFKSYSTNYLVWLFSNQSLKLLYNNFLEDESEDFIKSLIYKYDLTANEPNICEAIKYYVNNFNKFYSDDLNVDSYYSSSNKNSFKTNSNRNTSINEQIDYIRAQVELLNINKIEKVNIIEDRVSFLNLFKNKKINTKNTIEMNLTQNIGNIENIDSLSTYNNICSKDSSFIITNSDNMHVYSNSNNTLKSCNEIPFWHKVFASKDDLSTNKANNTNNSNNINIKDNLNYLLNMNNNNNINKNYYSNISENENKNNINDFDSMKKNNSISNRENENNYCNNTKLFNCNELVINNSEMKNDANYIDDFYNKNNIFSNYSSNLTDTFSINRFMIEENNCLFEDFYQFNSNIFQDLEPSNDIFNYSEY